MRDELNRNIYLIKEHVGLFKAANNYDVYDPETGQMIMHCREDNLGILTKILRFSDAKRMTPFDVRITDLNGRQILRVSRGVAFLISKVLVFDENDRLIGSFKQKLFSIGGAFDLLNRNDEPVCQLKGSLMGWEFKFSVGDVELAEVTKKWMGIGKEMFTSADNYVLKIHEGAPANPQIRQLILGCVMCIDMVLKE